MNNRIAVLVLAVLSLCACAGAPKDLRPEPLKQAERTLAQGVRAFENGDFPAASAMFVKAHGLYRSLDHRQGLLQSLINLAETALATGNAALARRYVDEAGTLAAGPAETRRLTALTGVLLLNEGKAAEASAHVAGLLPEFDDANRPRSAVDEITLAALTLRARVAFSAESLADARLWTVRLAQSLPKAGGNTALHKARLLRFQADLARRDGHYASAQNQLDAALELYRASANRPGTAAALHELGNTCLDAGEFDKARETLARALYIQLWIADRPGAIATLQSLAAAQEKSGLEEKAKASREWAKAIESSKDVHLKEIGRNLSPF